MEFAKEHEPVPQDTFERGTNFGPRPLQEGVERPERILKDEEPDARLLLPDGLWWWKRVF